MKKQLVAVAAISAALGTHPTAYAQGVLTGDTRLACEAMLCLPFMASAPAECTRAIARYTAIVVLDPLGVVLSAATHRARQNNPDGSTSISNSLPSFYGTSVAVQYTGTPEQGGRWYDAQ